MSGYNIGGSRGVRDYSRGCRISAAKVMAECACCHHRQYEPAAAFGRASPPRCSACGNIVAEVPRAAKRRAVYQSTMEAIRLGMTPDQYAAHVKREKKVMKDRRVAHERKARRDMIDHRGSDGPEAKDSVEDKP